jgi:hypothetical protein
MKSNRTKMRIGGAIAVLSLLFVMGSVSLQTVQAENRNDVYGQDSRYGNQNRRGRNWDNYGNYGGSSDLRQTALNAGYNEGMKDGTAARQKSRNYNDFRNQSAYRKATKDYSSRLGDRGIYQRYFREAYETGFNDGFNPQGSYNNNNRNDNNRNRDWNNNNNNNNNDNGNWDRNNRRGRNWDKYGSYGGNSNLRQTALNAGYNEGVKEGRKDRNRNDRSDFRNNSAYQNATTDYSSKLGDRNLYQRYYREGYENGYYDGLNGY